MTDAESRGLKLIPANVRQAHPRAQVQSLRRIATRALNTADRAVEYSNDHAEAAKLRAKAADALAAMQWLNTEHKLGY